MIMVMLTGCSKNTGDKIVLSVEDENVSTEESTIEISNATVHTINCFDDSIKIEASGSPETEETEELACTTSEAETTVESTTSEATTEFLPTETTVVAIVTTEAIPETTIPEVTASMDIQTSDETETSTVMAEPEEPEIAGNDGTEDITANGSYIVQPDDTGWYRISLKLNCDMYALAAANGRSVDDFIYEGEVLVVPNVSQEYYTNVGVQSVEQPIYIPEEVLIGSTTLKSYAGDNSWYNITLALDNLNGMVISKGSGFDWWRDMGPCDNAHGGYIASTVFVNGGETGTAEGGGICFVSTLLYQTARSSEMEITKRRTHSNDVKYASHDDDATVSYGDVNFAFKNNTGSDIKIQTSYDGTNRVGTVSFYAVS